MLHVLIILNVHILDYITKYNLLRFFFLLEKPQGILMGGWNLGLQDQG